MRRIASAVAMLAAALPVVLLTTAEPAAAATITVTSNADSGAGSLRAAIDAANATDEADVISFNIAGGDLVINALSTMPTLSKPVTIDATTQPGYSGTPLIELRKASSGTTPLGVSAPSTIRGLSVTGWGTAAIYVAAAATIQDNYIGVRPDGTAAGNGERGIWIAGGSGTVVSGNVISANSSSGIVVGGPGTGTVTVSGNKIGTNPAGTAVLGTQQIGVEVGDATGPVTIQDNVISGHTNRGVHISGSAATLRGNLVGTNAAGSGSIPNAFGVNVAFNGVVVGGAGAGQGNTISGNTGTGLQIEGAAHNTVVEGNRIGTNSGGTAALPNGGPGVNISQADGSIGTIRVGGPAVAQANVISGNAGNGITTTGCFGRGDTIGVVIQGNRIGTDSAGTGAVGNGGHGVAFVRCTREVVVGGANTGEGNLIANNSGDGVAVTNPGAGDVVRNRISANRISSNAGLAIDLADDGVTPNDPGDTDSGPNLVQNFPAITSASSTSSATTVGGTLSSAATTTYRIEVFATPSCDASGNGEATTFLGAFGVTTDGTGSAAFEQALSVGSEGQALSATATDSAGNTSELSACRAVPATPPATTTTTTTTTASTTTTTTTTTTTVPTTTTTEAPTTTTSSTTTTTSAPASSGVFVVSPPPAATTTSSTTTSTSTTSTSTTSTSTTSTSTTVPSRTLTIVVSGPAAGVTAVNAPAGIDGMGGPVTTLGTRRYGEGARVTLSSRPSPGIVKQGPWAGCASERFQRGSGDLLGNFGAIPDLVHFCDVVMDTDRTVTLNSALIGWTVNVVIEGPGTVAAKDLECLTNCSGVYEHGRRLTLDAIPNEGMAFLGWFGRRQNCGTARVCALSVDGNMTGLDALIAYFGAPPSRLTVSKVGAGAGTVTSDAPGNLMNCGSDCTATVNRGTRLTLRAQPIAGHEFGGWGGACTGVLTCEVVVDGVREVTARFRPINATIRISKIGLGTVTGGGTACGLTCTSVVKTNAPITLTATPAAGWRFVVWEHGGCAGSGTCTISPQADTAVTARFEVITKTLSLTVTGPGTVTSSAGGLACPPTCSAAVPQGSRVTLTANPANDQRLRTWGRSCHGRESTCTVTLTADRDVSAEFVATPKYELTVRLQGHGTAQLSGPGTFVPTDGTSTSTCTKASTSSTGTPKVCKFNAGGQVRVTGVAMAADRVFDGFSGDCSGAVCVLDMTRPRAVDVHMPQVVTLPVSLDGGGHLLSDPAPVCAPCQSFRFKVGSVIKLTAVPDAGKRLDHWLDSCEPTHGPTCTLRVVGGPQRLGARFTGRDIPVSVTATVLPHRRGGTVSSSPAGLTCRDGMRHGGIPVHECSGTFPAGAPLVLRGEPDAGWRVKDWGLEGCVAANECTIVPTQSLAPDVVFEPVVTRTIRTTVRGAGTVSTSATVTGNAECRGPGTAPKTCTWQVVGGQPLELSVANGSFNGAPHVLRRFGGDCTGTTCEFARVERDLAIEADFVRVYHFDLVTEGAGEILADPPPALGPSSFFVGDRVTFTARPEEGHTFSGWVTPIRVDCPNTAGPTCAFTVGDSGVISGRFKAKFSPVARDFPLTVRVQGSGTVTSTPGGLACKLLCQHRFATLTNVRLVPHPDPGWIFVRWELSNGVCQLRSRCEVTVNRAKTAIAHFKASGGTTQAGGSNKGIAQ